MITHIGQAQVADLANDFSRKAVKGVKINPVMVVEFVFGYRLPLIARESTEGDRE